MSIIIMLALASFFRHTIRRNINFIIYRRRRGKPLKKAYATQH